MTDRTLDTSKYLYEFVGGELNGKMWHYAALEVRNLIKGYSTDLSEQRAKGILCKRAELDNQPLIDGYMPPMYDGKRYLVNGELKSEWQCTEAQKANNEFVHIIRYETEEVYDMMSN
jgi:hypothetical protein